MEHANQILELETHSSENFWDKHAIVSLLGSDNVIGVGIFNKDQLVGFAISFVEYEKATIQILNIVVHPDYRRKYIGTKLLNKIANINKNIAIVAAIRESNKLGQIFLSKNKFKATGVSREFFKDEWVSGTETEDAYIFVLER